jgi:hypothetical protein
MLRWGYAFPMTNSETLTGRTTRSILFRDKYDVTCTATHQVPEGTTVYVTENRRGELIACIPGTLLEQFILPIDVEPF